MGTFTETLRLLVDADTKGAVQNVEKLGAAAEREASRSQKSLDKWGNRLTSIGTGMIAFGGAALFGLGKMAMASEEANLATVKLDNTLANMPKLAGENSQQFVDLAESIQDVTAADADAIVEGQALLGTFNLTAKEIKGITPLVVDYARKFGTDIPTAAIQVGKALDGSIGALKKNGVSINEALYATDRYAAVQEALADQVGGFAEAEGKTFAGSLERLKNQLGDLSEGVGAGAVDAFGSMFGAVDAVTDRLNEFSPGVQSTIGKVATFGAVGLVAAGGLSALIGQAIKARENFSALGEGVSAISGKIGGLRGAAAIAGGALGLAGLAFALSEISANANRVDVDLDDLAASLADTTKAGREALEMQIKGAVAFGTLDDLVTKVADSNFLLADSVVDVAQGMGVEADEVDKLRGIIKDKEAADVQGRIATEDHSEAVEEGAEAMDDSAEATEDAKTALQEWADAQRAMLDPLFAFNDAILANEEAQSKVTAAELGLIAADRALAKARKEHGRSSDEATEASLALLEAQRDLDDANRDAIASAVDYEAAFADLKAGLESGTVRIGDARAAVDRWAASGRISAATATFFKGEIDKLTGAIKAVPPNKKTEITTNAVQAREGILAVDRALRGIPPLTFAQIEVAVKTKGGIPIPGGKLYHGGGIVDGPMGADVPITAQAGEGVFTRGQMAAIGAALSERKSSGGSGDSTVINVNVYPQGSVLTSRSLIDEINAGLDRGLELRQRGRVL